uniref:Si:ch73-54n14.2 n=1 Tax=Echeneis naucrates TaxID=173247 RepID=A0A665WZ15_ECHNA
HGPLLTCSIYAFVGNSKMLLSFYSQFSQVLCQKQVDSPEIKHASVRRFATFDLFSRKRLATQDPSDTSDDQWVEYRSVFFREYSALLRDSLGPLRVNEVLTSFDNTGNVYNISYDRAQWQLSFLPARIDNPFSLQRNNRINTFFL